MERKFKQTQEELNRKNLELIYIYQQTGDEKVFNQLLEINTRMIEVLAIKFRNLYTKSHFSMVEKDDVIQIAKIAFYNAVKEFDFSKQTTFSTYYYTVCTHELSKTFIYLRRHERPDISLESPTHKIGDDGKDSALLKDVVKDDTAEKKFSKIENKIDFEIMVADIKKFLPEKYFAVLQGVIDNKNHAEIAKELGVSRQNVSNVISKISATLRKKSSYFRKIYEDLIKANEGKDLKKRQPLNR